MSSLNVVKQRDRVVLITDGAVYDMSTGIVQGFPAKQATLPSLPAVLATRGAPLATPIYAHLLGLRFQSFDAMIAGIENDLPDIHARVRLLCRGNVDEPIFIAGWLLLKSQRRKFQCALATRAPPELAGAQLAARQLNCESVFRGVLSYGRGRNNARAGSVTPRRSAQPGAVGKFLMRPRSARLASQRPRLPAKPRSAPAPFA